MQPEEPSTGEICTHLMELGKNEASSRHKPRYIYRKSRIVYVTGQCFTVVTDEIRVLTCFGMFYSSVLPSEYAYLHERWVQGCSLNKVRYAICRHQHAAANPVEDG